MAERTIDSISRSLENSDYSTLTDADIEAVSRKIVEKVEKATGGRLRA